MCWSTVVGWAAMAERGAMIEARGLRKVFGPRIALAGVDLTVGRGERVALMGPNGAGKTTLLRILVTLDRPSGGELWIGGKDPARDGRAIRRRVGFLSHETLLYWDLTAVQNLRFYAQLYGLENGDERVQELLSVLGLSLRQDDLVRTLSRGMRQRLALARALLHRPELLLLDEPYTGLDAEAVGFLTGLMKSLSAEGTTVLFATHNLTSAFGGERAIVLFGGSVVYKGALSDKAAFSARYERLLAGERGRG